MAEKSKWKTPFLKQSFVVTGVSLNMANFGAVLGFTAVLLPQLRSKGSGIPVNASSESWIASIVGISLVIGNLIVPSIMGRFGRKKASLFSCLLILICWLWIGVANDVTSILIARLFQGFALGINLSLSPIMVGEFTSPVNRGLFSTVMTATITAVTLAVHVTGSFFHWQTTALIFAVLCFISFAILIFIPESPSWLADRGRFDESRKSYRKLRGEDAEEELEKMLEARKNRDEGKNQSVKSFIAYFSGAFKKKEFYKPVLIMIHMYTIALWTGMCFLIVFTIDTIHILIGKDTDTAFHITILDTQRMISTLFGMFLVKKLKRRTVIFSTIGLNFLVLIIIAIYTYAKEKDILPFDHPLLGIVLLHVHMFSVTTGALPLPILIAGEIFPIEFRSLAGGISAVAFSINYFITSKTALYLLRSIGFYGLYVLYAAVTLYCLVYIWMCLPETKDRTLLDIEEEFKGVKGKKIRTDEEAAQALATWNKKEDI